MLAGVLPDHGRTLRHLRDGDGMIVDHALVLTFAEERSFTGEAVVELHLHGSPAVVAAIMRLLGKMPGLRPAEAGEFTRRAMESGRLDLAQVEGLADLIDAETEVQRRQAMRILSGALAMKAERWRIALIRAAALIEATIDFADEDVPVDVSPEVQDLLSAVRLDLVEESAGVSIAERVRDGFEVAIVGEPNVGKSTLLNYLAGRDVSITSVHAGTTRDVIEVHMNLDGLPVTILDTAGIRASVDEVEQIGIQRARERAMAADLRIHLLPAGHEAQIDVMPGDVVVGAKADVSGEGVSGLTGQGVDRLISDVGSVLRGRVAMVGTAMRERHRLSLDRAVVHLDAAMTLLPRAGESPDILAEELRCGIAAIDSLVGRVGVEDLLDEIFASFCIGK